MNLAQVAIIGAGNGGQSFAAHLALLGFSVRLWDVEKEKVDALKKTRRIRVSGAVTGEGVIDLVTGDIGEAVRDVGLIMVVIPTVYQGSVARAMAPYLKDGQVIVLHPGATGGALEVRTTIREAGSRATVTLAETDTLLYACRSPRAGEAIIHGIKDRVNVATLPAAEAPRVAALLNAAFPQYTPVSNVLVTSLNNGNAMMHPAPTLLNAGRVESQSPFEYYSEGVTPSIARVVEAIDSERLAVARSLDVTVPSIGEWYTACYGVTGKDLYAQVQQVKAYGGIKGPTTLNTRYLFEDIPTGLVPLSLLGRAMGVATPAMEAVVTLGNALLERDFWREGRSLEKLGLAGKSSAEIQAVVVN